jgi:hypothetical protein
MLNHIKKWQMMFKNNKYVKHVVQKTQRRKIN